MTPDTTNRQKSYAHIAKLLDSASKSYENAALGLEQGGSEEQAYQHIKNARTTLEAAFPEFFTVHKPSPISKTVPQKRDYSIIKIGLNEGKLKIDTNRDYNNPSIRIYLFQVKIENINNKK